MLVLVCSSAKRKLDFQDAKTSKEEQGPAKRPKPETTPKAEVPATTAAAAAADAEGELLKKQLEDNQLLQPCEHLTSEQVAFLGQLREGVQESKCSSLRVRSCHRGMEVAYHSGSGEDGKYVLGYVTRQSHTSTTSNLLKVEWLLSVGWQELPKQVLAHLAAPRVGGGGQIGVSAQDAEDASGEKGPTRAEWLARPKAEWLALWVLRGGPRMRDTNGEFEDRLLWRKTPAACACHVIPLQ